MNVKYLHNMRRLAALYALLCVGLAGETAPAGEVAVKAGFLFNFAQFVDWPPAAGTAPFEFCVVGDEEVADYLRAHLAGRSLGAQPVAVRIREAASELGSCRVIYIGRREKKNAAKYAQAMAGRPILIVSEFPELGDKGVVINFYLDEQRVRFEINLATAERSGLKIRSRLLNLARVVGGK
jgi:hypothetical protein